MTIVTYYSYYSLVTNVFTNNMMLRGWWGGGHYIVSIPGLPETVKFMKQLFTRRQEE